MQKQLKKILKVNPKRSIENFGRRCFKLFEEASEVTTAFLSVTSFGNGKGNSWDDVREETVDTLIMALDILYTRLPGEEKLTEEEFAAKVEKIIDQKVKKWARQIKEGRDITMSVDDRFLF